MFLELRQEVKVTVTQKQNLTAILIHIQICDS